MSRRPLQASICSPARLPAHRARDQAFLWGHVPAFLSSGGLKAHASRFAFMYKGPLIQSDERRAAAGRGGDAGLGTFYRTGWEATGHPSCRGACQAGSEPHPGHRPRLPADPWGPSLKVQLPPQGRPTTPNLSSCPICVTPSSLRVVPLPASPSTSRGPRITLLGLSSNWKALENDLWLFCQGAQPRDI